MHAIRSWETVRVFLLGMAVAFLAVIAFRPSSQDAWAQQFGGASSANGIIVTGLQGPDKDAAIVVINTNTKTMAYYRARMGQGMKFISGRYIGNDLEIYELEKTSGISVKEAENEARKNARRVP